MGTHGIRLSTATFAFDAAGFSQLETALLHGVGKPNQAGHYPTGFFPEALAVVESAQNYSTSRELPLSQGLSDLCTSALKAAETLREQGQPYRALQIAAAVMSRADFPAVSHFHRGRKVAIASWQACDKGEVRDAWNATALLGRALSNRSRLNGLAGNNISALFLLSAAIAVVEQEKTARTAPRPAPALA